MMYLFLFLNIIFPLQSELLLVDLYNQNEWIENYKTNDGKIIYESNDNINGKYIKVEKKVSYLKTDIFKKLKSISDYNQIISNKNVDTKLLIQDGDTLYAYQRINNSVPFIRDRQYIFKMYQINENRLDWYILDRNHRLLKKFIDEDVHTLSYGAGSWYLDRGSLSNRIFVDDEVNLPIGFLHKVRVNNVIEIFNDVINSLNKEN